ERRDEHAHDGGGGDLDDGARNGNLADGKEVFEGEMKPDAEHEEHDADFGQLAGHGGVGHEPWGGGADADAGKEVPDERGELQAESDEAEDKGEAQARGDRRDQRKAVIHSQWSDERKIVWRGMRNMMAVSTE